MENWPDRNVPTLFFYNEGELKDQILTLKSLGGDAFREDHLEWWMANKDIVQTELEEDPLLTASRKTVKKVIGKHTTRTASVYSDEEEDFDDM